MGKVNLCLSKSNRSGCFQFTKDSSTTKNENNVSVKATGVVAFNGRCDHYGRTVRCLSKSNRSDCFQCSQYTESEFLAADVSVKATGVVAFNRCEDVMICEFVD